MYVLFNIFTEERVFIYPQKMPEAAFNFFTILTLR